MVDRVLEMLSARWLIHRDTALSYLPLFISFLQGGEKLSSFMPREEEIKRSRAKVLSLGTGGWSSMATEYELSDPNIPDNSIAWIPIWGTILSWRSMNLIEVIRKARANDKIIALVFPVNSPGGMVFYTDILAAEIKEVGKPTVAAIMNMSASAALWLTSSMDYRIATSAMDSIGSIGVFTSFTDMQVLLKEKLGITIIDLYATKSTRKNEMVRSLLEGNTKPIIDDLDFVNEIFHAAIRQNLGIKADSEVFTGAIYNAQDALVHGLINEINSLDFAIEYAYKQGLTNKINHFKTQL
jgi:ClpP class serine protease